LENIDDIFTFYHGIPGIINDIVGISCVCPWQNTNSLEEVHVVLNEEEDCVQYSHRTRDKLCAFYNLHWMHLVDFLIAR